MQKKRSNFNCKYIVFNVKRKDLSFFNREEFFAFKLMVINIDFESFDATDRMESIH